MRAALGLPATQVIDDSTATAFLQAHRQQQQQQQQQQAGLQRDLQIRQLLLQEQLEQQVQERQLRAIGEQLQEFPDLQQHYQSLLISEQLNRRREQQAQQAQQVAQLRQQEELRIQQLAFLSDEATAQSSLATAQQAQVQQNQHPASPSISFQAASGLPAAAQLRAQDARFAAAAALKDMETPTVPSSYNRGALLEAAMAANVNAAGTTPASQSVPASSATAAVAPRRTSLKRTSSLDSTESDQKPKAKRSKRGNKSSKASNGSSRNRSSPQGHIADSDEDEGITMEETLHKLSEAAEMASPRIIRKGTIDGLVDASKAYQKLDDAAGVLRSMEQVEWSDSESEADIKELGKEDEVEIVFSKDPKESFSSPGFQSALPCLPEEPLLTDEEAVGSTESASMADNRDPGYNIEGGLGAAGVTPIKGSKGKKKVSAVLEYPVPIDTWWPSLNGMRRERHNLGETSDEDAFEDTTTEATVFRANERKIRNRLSKCAEPGSLEKLPHCRLHRVRTKRKKNSSAPEFVYCWQVTEIYPNDLIVCCSKCGTWRHPACGGHYEAYSTRKNTKKPFNAVCESCHEEEKYLAEFPLGAERIERQRIEQLRCALSTSSVMRQASFSKHGGTYKWPLGSVSTTHIAGHTRSVHARHDKAEKQWSDMGLRLSRGFGYRPKERVKSRTKELERLMVSVEDAEACTERHNMIHFLIRDTERCKPVGYENELANIFDSGHDGVSVSGRVDENTPSMICARNGCNEKPRFDSVFCSDACGVSALEVDLLNTLFDAGDIHPSVLRP